MPEAWPIIRSMAYHVLPVFVGPRTAIGFGAWDGLRADIEGSNQDGNKSQSSMPQHVTWGKLI